MSMLTKLSGFRQKTDKLLQKKELVEIQLEKEKSEFNESLKELEASIEVQDAVQQVIQSIQQKAHDGIAGVVTRCLETVFDDTYEFNIRFDRKRGKTEARFVLSKDGVEFDDLLNEVGGGVIDVISLALRLACVMMKHPKRDRVLILDEPFRNVRGITNKKRLRKLLIGLADELGFQFILNVDAEAYPEFVLGKTISLGE